MTTKPLAAFAFLAIAVCAALQGYAREAATTHKAATEIYEHVAYLPPGWALELMSLGQREALADLLWARALIYLGEETVRNLSADYVLEYGRAITRLDRHFSAAYRVLAISANARPGLTEAEVTQRIRKSLVFLEEGVRALPGDGELAWDTGSIYAYTLAPRLEDEEEYRAAKLRGLEHMQAATVRGAGPPWAGVANASTLIRLGQTEQAIAHLQELYAITSDPDVRRDIEGNLAHLRSVAFMEGLREVSAELSRDHERDFPYVSETLYLLLGPRPPFDRMAWLGRRFDPIADAESSGALADVLASPPAP